MKRKTAGARSKRKVRIRKKVAGTAGRPRLSVYRSGKHIHVQLVDDTDGKTLASASTLSADIKGKGEKSAGIAAAKTVGAVIAEKALAKNIERVVFDRSGYLYHGRVKALADAAREKGLKF